LNPTSEKPLLSQASGGFFVPAGSHWRAFLADDAMHNRELAAIGSADGTISGGMFLSL
jgi:hypothetical protein